MFYSSQVFQPKILSISHLPMRTTCPAHLILDCITLIDAEYELCQGAKDGTEVLTTVSQTVPSGHREAPRRIYAFRPLGALLVMTV
jgi:hypothetical protein